MSKIMNSYLFIYFPFSYVTNQIRFEKIHLLQTLNLLPLIIILIFAIQIRLFITIVTFCYSCYFLILKWNELMKDIKIYFYCCILKIILQTMNKYLTHLFILWYMLLTFQKVSPVQQINGSICNKKKNSFAGFVS